MSSVSIAAIRLLMVSMALSMSRKRRSTKSNNRCSCVYAWFGSNPGKRMSIARSLFGVLGLGPNGYGLMMIVLMRKETRILRR